MAYAGRGKARTGRGVAFPAGGPLLWVGSVLTSNPHAERGGGNVYCTTPKIKAECKPEWWGNESFVPDSSLSYLLLSASMDIQHRW
jgi:hypothetical protein